MNPQLRRRIASAALIIGFFVVWEVLCLAFGVKDIVLPRPTPDRAHAGGNACRRIWPHALQTLYTTLVGFALGIVARRAARRASSARRGSPTTWPIRC